jgi:DNA-3-methyladenine glycosylase II
LTDRDWKPTGVCLRQQGDGAVVATVYGDAALDAIHAQTARILSLDVDGRRWAGVGSRDPVVARLQSRFPGFRPVNWSNAYEAAAWSLISTRIAMRQAQGIKERMCRELGASVDVHGHTLYCFPGPDALVHLASFKGLFGRKVEYLNELGGAALAGELDTERLRALSHEEALARLKRLKGIGEFGSQLVRLRALSAVDELPTAEPRLLNAVAVEYGLDHEPDVAELNRIAEAWRPYRMWVAVCLRRTLSGGAGMIHSRAARQVVS